MYLNLLYYLISIFIKKSFLKETIFDVFLDHKSQDFLFKSIIIFFLLLLFYDDVLLYPLSIHHLIIIRKKPKNISSNNHELWMMYLTLLTI